jgi:transketolase
MRNYFARKFHELSKSYKELCLVVADISPAGSAEDFRKEFPERFINTGVAEQAMIGICAGMALRGLRPFAYTIATFSLYRPFEMVRNDLAYQNLPVTVVGIGGGLAYSSLGGTHHAQEDVFIATSIPNMQVVAPSDPLEVEAITEYCAVKNSGPLYLRLGKAGEAIFTEKAVDKFEFGKARCIRRGRDICIVSYGSIMSLAINVADLIRDSGGDPSVFSFHTLKPFDKDGALYILQNYSRVVVVEEVSPSGYVADMFKKIAWDNKMRQVEILSFSLQDKFIHSFGSNENLLNEHGLSVGGIFKSVTGLTL